MPELIGIDHIYITVSDVTRSEQFYDVVLCVLGFRKNQFELDGGKHVQYYNRHFGYVLRPVRSAIPHHSYALGLHHFCLRVEGEKEVDEAVRLLRAQGIAVGEPRRHSEYAGDYYAAFFSDPDGIRLEISN